MLRSVIHSSLHLLRVLVASIAVAGLTLQVCLGQVPLARLSDPAIADGSSALGVAS